MRSNRRKLDYMKPIQGESAQDFHRFCVYRDLGARRSLRAVASRCGLSMSRTKQLSSRHAWRLRAEAWDAAAREKRRQRELTRARDGSSALLHEALDWQKLARAGLAGFIRRTPGGELELTRDLKPREALRLWRVGCEWEQRLRGLSHATPPQQMEPPSATAGFTGVLKLCALEATAHLLALGAEEERSDALEGACMRLYHSVATMPDRCPVGPSHCSVAELLGYRPQDFEAFRLRQGRPPSRASQGPSLALAHPVIR